MTREILIKKLQSILKLNSYESKVYFALIAYGPQSASEVYKKANIPQPRSYDILQSLKEKELISLTPGKRNIFKAIRPTNAFGAYFKNEEWNFENRISKKREKFEIEINNLKKLFINNFKRRRNESKKLTNFLESIFEKNIKEPEELIWFMKGKQNLSPVLSELIDKSEKNILSMTAPPHLPVALIWESICNALKKNIHYRHLTYEELILEWGYWRIQEDSKKGVEFKFLPLKELDHKFYIIDNKKVFVWLEDQLTKQLTNTAINFEHPKFVDIYQSIFINRWGKAKSTKIILKIIKSKLESLKLTRDEEKVMKEILKRGKYADINKFEVLGKEVLNNLKRKDLILPFEESLCGYIANPKKFL